MNKYQIQKKQIIIILERLTVEIIKLNSKSRRKSTIRVTTTLAVIKVYPLSVPTVYRTVNLH